MTFREITHPEDRAADAESIRRLVAGEIERYSLEKRYVRKDRSLRWVHVTVSAVKRPEGDVETFIGIVEDISSRRHLEEELTANRRRLEEMAATHHERP